MTDLTEIARHNGWHGWESTDDGGKPSGHLYASTAHRYYGQDCSGTTVDALDAEKLEAQISALERAA